MIRSNSPYVKFALYLLLFALLTGAWTGCGKYTHADPAQLAQGVPTELADQKTVDWRDFLSILIGWQSYEDMQQRQGKPLYISYQEAYADNTQSDIYVAGIVTISPNGAINRLEEIGRVTVLEGELLPVHARTAALMINDALRIGPLTQLWEDPSGQFYVALKGVTQAGGSGAWFVGVVDRTSNSILQLCSQVGSCGSYASAKSAGEIAELMRASGYRILVSPSEVDPKVSDFFKNEVPKILAAGTGGGYWGASQAWIVSKYGGISATPFMVPAFSIVTITRQIICPGCLDEDELPQN